MQANDIAEMQGKCGINDSKLCKMLGISRDRLRKMKAGKAPIPGFMGLACAAIVWGLPPWEKGSGPVEAPEVKPEAKSLVIGGE